jgi:tetratricopeptide (TPR) repeat protein
LPDIYESLGVLGSIDLDEIRLSNALAKLTKSRESEKEKTNPEELEARFRWRQLLVANLAADALDQCVPEAARLTSVLPDSKVSDDNVVPVERLFFSAFLSARDTFETNTVQSVADMKDTSRKVARQMMLAVDTKMASYSACWGIENLHYLRQSTEDPEQARFLTVAATQVYATNLALITGLVTKWEELDISFDDDGVKYGRPDLLNYLITRAQEKALANIQECKNLGIPCIAPIGCVEDGDLSRDDKDVDKVDVLISYWKASLQAKAMTMLFVQSTAVVCDKGNKLYDAGHFAEAIRCYDKVLDIDPKAAYAWANKGNSLSNLGQYKEASICFDKALDIDPKFASAWINKGNALNSLGKAKDAITCIDKALELDPGNAGGWYSKGLVCENGGFRDEAIVAWKKYLELAKDDPSQRDWMTKAQERLRELQSK